MNIYFRNPQYAILHPARTWRVSKLCRDHVKANPKCAWCGGTEKVQGHHIISIWADETLAADPDNIISLCMKRRCHLVVGHGGSFATRYVPNVREICEQRKITERKLTARTKGSSMGSDNYPNPGASVCHA